jgi:hypothetical protein
VTGKLLGSRQEVSKSGQPTRENADIGDTQLEGVYPLLLPTTTDTTAVAGVTTTNGKSQHKLVPTRANFQRREPLQVNGPFEGCFSDVTIAAAIRNATPLFARRLLSAGGGADAVVPQCVSVQLEPPFLIPFDHSFSRLLFKQPLEHISLAGFHTRRGCASYTHCTRCTHCALSARPL